MDVPGVRRRTTAFDRRVVFDGGRGGGPPSIGPIFVALLRMLAFTFVALLLPAALGVVGYVERAIGVSYTAMQQRPARVALVDLPANRRARGGEPPALARWRRAAERAGLELELLAPESLAEVDTSAYAAWVLPEQERMADADWEQLQGLPARDVGLVLTGDPGLQTERGKRRADPLLPGLASGGSFSRESPRERELRVDARGPLIAGLAPQGRVELALPRRVLVSAGAGPLVWRDVDGAASGAAAAHWLRDGVPVIWLGFGAASIADEALALELCANALSLAARRPIAALRPWPRGAPASALVRPHAGALAAVEALVPPVKRVRDPELLGAPDLALGRLLAAYGSAERRAALLAFDGPSEPDERSESLYASLREALDRQAVWLAEPQAVAAWWRQVRSVDVTLELLGAGRARVSLQNGGVDAVHGATVRVFLPPGARPPTAVASEGRSGSAHLRVARDRASVDLILPPLPPGREAAYAFRF